MCGYSVCMLGSRYSVGCMAMDKLLQLQCVEPTIVYRTHSITDVSYSSTFHVSNEIPKYPLKQIYPT